MRLPSYVPVANWNERTDDDDETVSISAYESVSPWDVDYFHHFRSWSDGGDRAREVTLLEEGGELTLNLATYYPIRISTVGAGRIDLSPSPEVLHEAAPEIQGYAEGARVQLNAVPEGDGVGFVAWLGDATGANPAASIVMENVRTVEALFSDLPELVPDEAEEIALVGSSESGLTHWTGGDYWVYVPFGATELAIELGMANPGAETTWHLAVRRNGELWIDDEGGITRADFRSALSEGSASIVVTPHSTPPLSAGPYFITVRPDSTASTGTYEGTLRAVVTDGLPVRAFPRVFTFVARTGSDPVVQTFRLTNEGAESLQFGIDTSQQWLSPTPQQGTLAAGEAVEVSVAVSSAGVLPDTHTGKLIVHSLPKPVSQEAPESGASVEIRITFAVVDQR